MLIVRITNLDNKEISFIQSFKWLTIEEVKQVTKDMRPNTEFEFQVLMDGEVDLGP